MIEYSDLCSLSDNPTSILFYFFAVPRGKYTSIRLSRVNEFAGFLLPEQVVECLFASQDTTQQKHF